MKHWEIKQFGQTHIWRKVWNDFQREHGKLNGGMDREEKMKTKL